MVKFRSVSAFGKLTTERYLGSEQVSRESLENIMIPWDFGESENACKLVK